MRKTSDVIIDMEQRITNLEALVQQIDINVKMLLNSKNMQLAKRPEAKPPKAVMATQHDPGPVAAPPVPTRDNVVFPSADALPATGSAPQKSVVEQRVTYSDGRPVILAGVIVKEANLPTNVIAKIRTDAHGKWNAQLFGGRYLIEVTKGPTSAKQGFRLEYEIEVPGDGKPLSLERKQVE